MLVQRILDHKDGSGIIDTSPEASVGDAAEVLAKRRIGAIIVRDNDENLAGILSERDIVRGLAAHGPGVLEMRVGELMTREVVTCTPESTVEAVMVQMTEGRFRHLPVAGDDGLVGMISIGDVVNSRLIELQEETSQLRAFIAGG